MRPDLQINTEKAMSNIDTNAMSRISYGLYIVTTNDGTRDNGCVVNTVSQVASSPLSVTVSISKSNYTHDTVRKTGKMNVNCLTTSAPFSVFENFGFKSGRNTDKLAGIQSWRGENGLLFLSDNVNAIMSLTVRDYVDLGSHGLFICSVTSAFEISDDESLTYTYYQKHIKPKPKAAEKKGFVCKICGYVYEGDSLPYDFVCPLCKHGAEAFEPLG